MRYEDEPVMKQPHWDDKEGLKRYKDYQERLYDKYVEGRPDALRYYRNLFPTASIRLLNCLRNHFGSKDPRVASSWSGKHIDYWNTPMQIVSLDAIVAEYTAGQFGKIQNAHMGVVSIKELENILISMGQIREKDRLADKKLPCTVHLVDAKGVRHTIALPKFHKSLIIALGQLGLEHSVEVNQ